MASYSTFINASTNDYELLDGKIVFANELATEAYSRIVTPKGSYYFDLNFGSTLFTLVGKRGQFTSQAILKSVNDALRPMISEGRALSVTVTVLALTLFSVTFSVDILDTNNSIFRFTIPYSVRG